MATLSKHAGAALVAVGFVAVAVAEGGADTELLAALTIGLWWIVIVGLVVRLWSGAEFPGVAVLAGLCLAGLTALTALSMLWADDAGRAFEDTLVPAAYLGLFVLALLVSRPASAREWLGGLAIGMVVVAALAFASRAAPGLLGGQAEELAADLPQSLERLSYPVGYWNALAALMAATVALLAWLGAYARERTGRTLAVAALPLPVLVIYLTQSRGGAVAALVGWGVLLLAGSRRVRVRVLAAGAVGAGGGLALVFLAAGREAFRSPVLHPDTGTQGVEMALALVLVSAACFLVARRLDGPLSAARLPRLPVSRRTAIAGVALVVAGLVAAVVASGATEEFSDPEGFIGKPDDRTSLRGSGRSQFWSTALDAFVAAPVGGVGAGNYELFWNGNEPIPVAVEHAHSLYLETLAELGPVGLALVLGFLGLGAAAGVARRGSSPGGEVAAGSPCSPPGPWSRRSSGAGRSPRSSHRS